MTLRPLTERQETALLWLNRAGRSQNLPPDAYRSMASLEKRGLVEGKGTGKHRDHTLTKKGEAEVLRIERDREN